MVASILPGSGMPIRCRYLGEQAGVEQVHCRLGERDLPGFHRPGRPTEPCPLSLPPEPQFADGRVASRSAGPLLSSRTGDRGRGCARWGRPSAGEGRQDTRHGRASRGTVGVGSSDRSGSTPLPAARLVRNGTGAGNGMLRRLALSTAAVRSILTYIQEPPLPSDASGSLETRRRNMGPPSRERVPIRETGPALLAHIPPLGAGWRGADGGRDPRGIPSPSSARGCGGAASAREGQAGPRRR